MSNHVRTRSKRSAFGPGVCALQSALSGRRGVVHGLDFWTLDIRMDHTYNRESVSHTRIDTPPRGTHDGSGSGKQQALGLGCCPYMCIRTVHVYRIPQTSSRHSGRYIVRTAVAFWAHDKLSFAVYSGCFLESPWGGGPVSMVLSPKTHLVSKKIYTQPA